MRVIPTPTVRSATKHQSNSHNTYADGMVQSNAGTVIVSLVIVSQYEFCLVNSVCVLDPFGSYNSLYPCVLREETQWRSPIWAPFAPDVLL